MISGNSPLALVNMMKTTICALVLGGVLATGAQAQQPRPPSLTSTRTEHCFGSVLPDGTTYNVDCHFEKEDAKLTVLAGRDVNNKSFIRLYVSQFEKDLLLNDVKLSAEASYHIFGGKEVLDDWQIYRGGKTVCVSDPSFAKYMRAKRCTPMLTEPFRPQLLEAKQLFETEWLAKYKQ